MSDKKKKILLNVLMCVAMAVMVIVAVFVVEKKSSDDQTTQTENTDNENETTGQVADQTISVENTEKTDTTEEADTTEEKDTTEQVGTTEKADTTEQAGTTEKTDTTEENGTTEQADITEAVDTTEPAETKSCTITIQCTSILENMDKLKEGKAAYVPESGYILSATVEYSEGDTVFDVLVDACSLYGIQIEYSYTPMYGSYYIEGINHLYEFDCGGTSGWMYSVNGVSPNYGCSGYNVSENDTIVWYYSCSQ